MRRDDGFTLIELLVVVLIIGILAAIAIPSLLGQRDRADDTEAQQVALTMRKAMEAYRTDTDSFVGVTLAALVDLEPSLAGPRSESRLVLDPSSATQYEVGARARQTGTLFFFAREGGQTERLCRPAGRGGCRGPGFPYAGLSNTGRWGG